MPYMAIVGSFEPETSPPARRTKKFISLLLNLGAIWPGSREKMLSTVVGGLVRELHRGYGKASALGSHTELMGEHSDIHFWFLTDVESSLIAWGCVASTALLCGFLHVIVSKPTLMLLNVSAFGGKAVYERPVSISPQWSKVCPPCRLVTSALISVPPDFGVAKTVDLIPNGNNVAVIKGKSPTICSIHRLSK